VLVFILLVAEAPGGWGQGQGEGEEERRESGGGLLLSSLVTSCGLGDQSRTLGCRQIKKIKFKSAQIKSNGARASVKLLHIISML
jgi:hypothetical protein